MTNGSSEATRPLGRTTAFQTRAASRSASASTVPRRQPGPAGEPDLPRGAAGALPDYELTGPPERVASTTVAGIRSLPVVSGRPGLLEDRTAEVGRSASITAGSALRRRRPAPAPTGRALAERLDVHGDGGLSEPEEQGEVADGARRPARASAGAPAGSGRRPPSRPPPIPSWPGPTRRSSQRRCR